MESKTKQPKQLAKYVVRDTKAYLDLGDNRIDAVCGAIKLVAHQTFIGSNKVGVFLEFQDIHGNQKSIVVPRFSLHGAGARRLAENLIDLGWPVEDLKQAASFLEYQYRENPPQETRLTAPIPGWHEINDEGDLAYVTSTGVFTRDGRDDDSVSLDENVETGVSSIGRHKDWVDSVARLCAGNPVLQFAICVVLASLILRFSGLPNFGFHLFGHSKTGKTKTLKVGASAVGNVNYVLTWNTTANALEVTALSRNDGCLILDEIQQCDPRAASEAVYDFGNGQTKSRMGADARLNSGRRFVSILLSSGEHDFREQLKIGGIEAKPGQLVRLISIPVPEKGLFIDLHDFKSPADFVEGISHAAEEQYGTLGVRFLTRFAQKQDQYKVSIPTRVSRAADKLISMCDPGTQKGTDLFVAKCFGLVAVAGEIAIAYKHLPWEKGDAVKAVEHCFMAWAKHEKRTAALPDEEILRYIQYRVQQAYPDKFLRFHSFGATPRKGIAGYQHKVDGQEVLLVLPAFFEVQICQRFGKKTVLRILRNNDFLIEGSRGTPMRQVSIPKDEREDGREKLGFYVIKASILSA